MMKKEHGQDLRCTRGGVPYMDTIYMDTILLPHYFAAPGCMGSNYLLRSECMALEPWNVHQTYLLCCHLVMLLLLSFCTVWPFVGDGEPDLISANCMASGARSLLQRLMVRPDTHAGCRGSNNHQLAGGWFGPLSDASAVVQRCYCSVRHDGAGVRSMTASGCQGRNQ
jgi:hypothetical protein